MSDSALHFISGENPHPREDAIVDIIFVHGLSGDHEESWKHATGGFWPKWLAEDFPDANIYCASYSSKTWNDIAKGSGASLIDLGSLLLDLVASKCGQQRPIIFITHSLGGLVVKQLLRKSDEASNTRKRSIAARTRLVAFLATPHQGAEIAKLVGGVVSALTSQVIKNMAHGEAPLIDLGEWFSAWAPNQNIEISSYYETVKYKGLIVVDKVAANPNVLGCECTALDDDHVSISKLASRSQQLYVSLSSSIRIWIDQLAAGQIDSAGWGREDLISEYESFTETAAADRRTLSQKLTDAGRVYEIDRAESLKERFSMSLHRHSAQPSAVERYTRLMSQVESRFNLHVVPAISLGATIVEVNQIIQNTVIDPVSDAKTLIGVAATPGVIESVIYYLAGNCHIGWDNA